MGKIADSYLRYGFSSEIAKKLEKLHLPINTFRRTSKENLIQKYKINDDEILQINTRIKRDPIPQKILQKLLENNNFICCICKGQKSDAYIIHHITKYSFSRDNSYENLAVLCPNDHDLAHKEGNAITNKLTEEQIKIAKKNWEQEVKRNNERASNKRQTDPPKINLENLDFSHCLREVFTRWILKELVDEKKNSINIYGSKGMGKTRLLEDIQKLKIPDTITVIGHFGNYFQDYEIFLKAICLQTDLPVDTFNDISQIFEKLSKKYSRIIFLLDDFDIPSSKYSTNTRKYNDINFFDYLNSIRHRSNISFLLTSQKIQQTVPLRYRDTITLTAPLYTGITEEIPPLTWEDIKKEIVRKSDNHQLNLSNYHKSLIIKEVQRINKPYTFLNYTLDYKIVHYKTFEEKRLDLEKKMNIWKKDFNRLYSESPGGLSKPIEKFLKRLKLFKEIKNPLLFNFIY